MWPWDHLALGYVGYSVYIHSRRGRPPGSAETLALAIGTQFPDLLDKPLAWQFHVLPSGTTLFHSAFTAVGLCGLLVYFHRTPVSEAFALGYLLHLPADMLYPALMGNGLWTSFLWWPLVASGPSRSTTLLSKTMELFTGALVQVQTPSGWVYLVVELCVLGIAGVLWLRDGHPGIGWN
ncbi:metal-dependent hydrolase [Halocatena halophila]|uniref:metal-dependent hydrolase n=1 Tax=Halocatena halophila TaxID=2814576 RepID=UPI002ED13D9A